MAAVLPNQVVTLDVSAVLNTQGFKAQDFLHQHLADWNGMSQGKLDGFYTKGIQVRNMLKAADRTTWENVIPNLTIISVRRDPGPMDYTYKRLYMCIAVAALRRHMSPGVNSLLSSAMGATANTNEGIYRTIYGPGMEYLFHVRPLEVTAACLYRVEHVAALGLNKGEPDMDVAKAKQITALMSQTTTVITAGVPTEITFNAWFLAHHADVTVEYNRLLAYSPAGAGQARIGRAKLMLASLLQTITDDNNAIVQQQI